jgi:hypothetical protein
MNLAALKTAEVQKQHHSVRFVQILYEVVQDGFEYSLSERTGSSEISDPFVVLRSNRNTRMTLFKKRAVLYFLRSNIS